MRSVTLLSFCTLLAMSLLVGGCVIDTDYPDSARLSCYAADECPEDWSCDEAANLCRAPGWTPPAADGDEVDGEDIYRGEEKRQFCGVLYDKLTECETETRAILTDDTYDVFVGSDKTLFVSQTCAVGMLGEMSDAELNEMLSNEVLIPAVACDLFASQLCAMLPDLPDLTTNCP